MQVLRTCCRHPLLNPQMANHQWHGLMEFPSHQLWPLPSRCQSVIWRLASWQTSYFRILRRNDNMRNLVSREREPDSSRCYRHLSWVLPSIGCSKNASNIWCGHLQWRLPQWLLVIDLPLPNEDQLRRDRTSSCTGMNSTTWNQSFLEEHIHSTVLLHSAGDCL